MELTKAQDVFETYSLTPFGCANCGSSACLVIPLMKQLTETNEPGLLIQCHVCGEEMGVAMVTTETYQLLLESELEILRREGQLSRESDK